MPTSQQIITQSVTAPFFEEAQDLTTPGAVQTLFQFTTPSAPTIRRPLSIRVVCRQESNWELFAGGTLIASGRTGPGQHVDDYVWREFRDLPADTIVKLQFQELADLPEVTVDAYFEASDLLSP